MFGRDVRRIPFLGRPPSLTLSRCSIGLFCTEAFPLRERMEPDLVAVIGYFGASDFPAQAGVPRLGAARGAGDSHPARSVVAPGHSDVQPGSTAMPALSSPPGPPLRWVLPVRCEPASDLWLLDLTVGEVDANERQ